MKGFDITIKNNLLDKKHFENMGMAVWLYMWLVDKITSINEDGIGKVLGGKPVKFEEIKEEFGISKATYTRWIETLSKYPYIKATRTPYGISYKVFKAHKRFRKNEDLDSAKMRNLSTENEESNKTVTVDNTVDIPEQSSGDVPKVIKAFESINPNCKRYYGNKTQRKACEFLIESYGFEKVLNVIEKALPRTNSLPFFPTITTPVTLAEKWSALENAIKKYNGKTTQLKQKAGLAHW